MFKGINLNKTESNNFCYFEREENRIKKKINFVNLIYIWFKQSKNYVKHSLCVICRNVCGQLHYFCVV